MNANASSPHAAHEKVALIVFHGIGQQVPYETIDSVVKVVLRAHDGDVIYTKAHTALANIGTDKAQPRAEVHLRRGDQSREVHVYEGYWAPLTAGEIGLVGVFRFLLISAFSGLVSCFRRLNFKRFMFGQWQEFRVHSLSWLWLALAALFVLSLWIMLTIVGATAFAVGLHFVLPSAVDTATGAAHPSTVHLASLPTPAFTREVTRVLSVFVVFMTALLAIAFSSWFWHLGRPVRKDAQLKNRTFSIGGAVLQVVPWLGVGFTIWMGILLVSAACMELARIEGLQHLAWHPNWPWPWLWDFEITAASRHAGFVWSAAVVAFFGLRYFLIEFCGDAAIYISAHKVSEHWRVREQIATKMYQLVRAIYAFRDESHAHVYDRVVIAGHSLGAMIAYDTLNRMLLEERNGLCKECPLERTAGLVTFGAALEKTAFIFRNQLWHEFELREKLAANRQPLIDGARWREPLRWINLLAWTDWVSSKLQYYDPDETRRMAGENWYVENRSDPYSATFIFPVSHVTYWKSPRLGECLLDLIFHARRAAPAPQPVEAPTSRYEPELIGLATAIGLAVAIGLLIARW